MYAAIRKPPPEPHSTQSKKKLLLDPSDLLHKELCAILLQLAPTSVLSRAPELGILCALDPYFLDDAMSQSVLACIFSLTLVWPTETVQDSDIQSAMDAFCARGGSSPIDTPITYKSSSSDGEITSVQLASRVAFAPSASDLFAFAARPPAATLNLSITFPFQCPQDVIDEKLGVIASRLWKRALSTAQLDEAFPRAYVSVDADRPIGRITNTFHGRFGLPRTEDPASRSLFIELCTLHYEFKKKMLDTSPDRNVRMSSLSFSFITDKGHKRRHTPPAWFDTAHEALKSDRPDLFDNSQPDGSSSEPADTASEKRDQRQQQ
jgi:hypothetical protein